jgi:hypothetical protein
VVNDNEGRIHSKVDDKRLRRRRRGRREEEEEEEEEGEYRGITNHITCACRRGMRSLVCRERPPSVRRT